MRKEVTYRKAESRKKDGAGLKPRSKTNIVGGEQEIGLGSKLR